MVYAHEWMLTHTCVWRTKGDTVFYCFLPYSVIHSFSLKQGFLLNLRFLKQQTLLPCQPPQPGSNPPKDNTFILLREKLRQVRTVLIIYCEIPIEPFNNLERVIAHTRGGKLWLETTSLKDKRAAPAVNTYAAQLSECKHTECVAPLPNLSSG